MYNYSELLAGYASEKASGSVSMSTIGLVMKELFQKGNVELLTRPRVSGMTMNGAGWDEVDQDSISTVYTLWYARGNDGESAMWMDDVILHMTPIKADGTVETPTHLDEYVDSLIGSTNCVAALLEADKPANGGKGLVICVQRVNNGWTKAKEEAEVYDNTLHLLQAAYYLNGVAEYPETDDLETIADWFHVYDIYISNYNQGSLYITDETLVYSVPFDPGDENVFINPKVTGDMGKAGTFEFEMQVGHPYYNSLCQMKTVFRVVYDGDTIFRGRVLTIDTSHMTGNLQVHCEGDLAFLLDSQIEGIPDSERTKMDAGMYALDLINQHNGQVDEFKKFVLGEVPGGYTNVTAADQRVHPDTNYRYGSGSWRDSQSAWNDLTGSFGGYLRTRYQNGTCYLDWLDQYYRSGVNPQVIEIGENLIDLTSNSEVNNIFTAVIPVGSRDGRNLYINGYQTAIHGNNNCIYVPDICKVFSDEELNKGFHSKADYQNAINDYGYIFHTEAFANAETQAQLWEYATDWIKNNYIGGLNSFSVSALDMHVIGGSSGKFLVGDKVVLRYPDVRHRTEDPKAIIEKTLTMMGATYELHNPDKNTYKIGVPNAILKRNYGEKKNKKSRTGGISSQLSGLGDDLMKKTEEEWEDTTKTYSDAQIWSSILDGLFDMSKSSSDPDFIKDQQYKRYVDTYGQDLVQKAERIAFEWLYAEMNGEESEYGSLTEFISSGFSKNATIVGLGASGREILKWFIVRAGNHNLPVWTQTKVTEYGSVTEIISATYAYPAVYHSRNGLPANIRKSGSSSSAKIGEVPNNSTVWCRSKPEEFTGAWMPIQFGNKFGYIQSQYLVQCTGLYNQGEGYPQLQETEKEEKTSTATAINGLLNKIVTSNVDLTDPEQISKVVQDEMLAKISMAGKDGEIKMGDGTSWLMNFLGEESKLEFGDGINTLLSIFGMNENGDSTSGLEFFKSLGPEVGRKILTAFTNGDTGVQTAVKAFFGGDDFTGINDLLEDLDIAPIKIDGANKTIEVGTGQSNDSATIKLIGDNGNGQGQEWVGRKPDGSWRIFLNENVSYKDESGNDRNAYGFVTADDFKIKDTFNSLKSKLLVVDQLVAGKIDTAQLNAFKAEIDELYATKAEIDGLLTADSILSGTAIAGDLYITSGTGADGKTHQGLLSATKAYITSIDVGSGGIRYYDESSQSGGNTYGEHRIIIGSKSFLGKDDLPYPHVLADKDLTFPDIIDASSFTTDDDLEEGKIGFKFKTYDNSNYTKVNFNIADTKYYKDRVGVNSAIMPNNPTDKYDDFSGYGTNNYNTNLKNKYLRLKIPSKAGEDYDYYIGIDATGVLSDENIAKTDFYKNSIGVNSAIMPNTPTDEYDDFARYGANNYNTNLKNKYLRLKIPSKAGEDYDYYIGIDASQLWDRGVAEGESHADTTEAYKQGYISGYDKAQTVTGSDPRISAYIDSVVYNNYTSYIASTQKLQIELNAYPKLKFRKLQNDSTDPAEWDTTATDGTKWNDIIEFPMAVNPVELYREPFDGEKFVVKAVGNTGWVKINDEEIDVPLKNPLEIPITGEIYKVNSYKWNTEAGDNQYKYTFTAYGNVKSGGDTLANLENSENVLNPTQAIEYGKNKMGISAEWKDNVLSIKPVESLIKKKDITVISYPAFEYDPDAHVYKLTSSAYADGIKIHTSAERSTGDAAYQDGLTKGRSEAQVIKGEITNVDFYDNGGEQYTYNDQTNLYSLYIRASGRNLENTNNQKDVTLTLTAKEAFEAGEKKGKSEAQVIKGEITDINLYSPSFAYLGPQNDHKFNIYIEATGKNLSNDSNRLRKVVTVTNKVPYEQGQKSVKVTAASIVANLDTYDGDYSDIPVQVSLLGQTSQTTLNVDMRQIYEAGKEGKGEITDQEFEFEFVDEDGAYLVVDDPYFTMNVNDIYKNGVRDAEQDDQNVRYIFNLYGNTLRCWYPSNGNRIYGNLYPNTKVEYVSTSDGYYTIKYGGYTMLISASSPYTSGLIEKKDLPSPTNYGTKTGWASTTDAGWVFTSTVKSSVSLKSGTSTSSTVVYTVPTNGTVYTQDDPLNMKPTDWIFAAYKTAERSYYCGWVQVKSIVGGDAPKLTGVSVEEVYQNAKNFNKYAIKFTINRKAKYGGSVTKTATIKLASEYDNIATVSGAEYIETNSYGIEGSFDYVSGYEYDNMDVKVVLHLSYSDPSYDKDIVVDVLAEMAGSTPQPSVGSIRIYDGFYHDPSIRVMPNISIYPKKKYSGNGTKLSKTSTPNAGYATLYSTYPYKAISTFCDAVSGAYATRTTAASYKEITHKVLLEVTEKDGSTTIYRSTVVSKIV